MPQDLETQAVEYAKCILGLDQALFVRMVANGDCPNDVVLTLTIQSEEGEVVVEIDYNSSWGSFGDIRRKAKDSGYVSISNGIGI